MSYRVLTMRHGEHERKRIERMLEKLEAGNE